MVSAIDNNKMYIVINNNFKLINLTITKILIKVKTQEPTAMVEFFTWKLSENNECIYCNEIETVEHHLFTCVEPLEPSISVDKRQSGY